MQPAAVGGYQAVVVSMERASKFPLAFLNQLSTLSWALHLVKQPGAAACVNPMNELVQINCAHFCTCAELCCQPPFLNLCGERLEGLAFFCTPVAHLWAYISVAARGLAQSLSTAQ